MAKHRQSDDCPRCDGEGQIADSESGEPWSAWSRLEPPQNLAVVMGWVQPVECPRCSGSGRE